MTLDMQLLVHRDVGDFVCGMAIRRADGLLLAGTNTFLDHVTVSTHSPGTDDLGPLRDQLAAAAGRWLHRPGALRTM